MSRIDQAWKRASGALTPASEISDRLDHLDDGLLHRYPREGATSHPEERSTSPSRGYQPDSHSPGLGAGLSSPMVVAPRTGERRQLGTLHPAYERKLVMGGKPSSIAVEQYRRLAGALHELQIDRGLKQLMVTSAAPHEGKTLTVVNLALTLSEACCQRVLLIDADLRRPFVHEVFRLPNARGLSDVLCFERGEVPLLEVSEHLSVLTAGQPDQPMAALTSDRMRTLLEQSSAAFDWILLDAPPVGVMADAQLLARITGAVLFVIAANSTPHQLVSRALAALDPECVVGTVLNAVEEQTIPAAGYYGDYYSPR
jgi:protein-tyrosine kinase